MGSSGKDDLHLKQTPISELVRQAAEPHADRGKKINFTVFSDEHDETSNDEPIVARSPQIIHGLRNLIQNAVDFASENVWIDLNWSEAKIIIRVADDGNGFPADMLGRMGEPFIKRRNYSSAMEIRPEYEGMGLGVFIAKTLLERSGASLSFSNNHKVPNMDEIVYSGALVEVSWPSNRISLEKNNIYAPLGENKLIK